MQTTYKEDASFCKLCHNGNTTGETANHEENVEEIALRQRSDLTLNSMSAILILACKGRKVLIISRFYLYKFV